MQFTGRLIDVSIDYNTRQPKVTFLVNEANVLEQIDEIRNQEKLKIEAKKYRNNRSLDANAYCWVLIGKLSQKLGIKPEEIYRKAVRESGVYTVIPVQNNAADRFIESWNGNGLGWICDTFKCNIEGWTNVKAYYGSSSYDTKEMSNLIDNIVAECKEQGIQTMEEHELNSLLKEWGDRK